jgi:VIT1/CCC1 family predicted Fe2+/Mn2+ transporter
MGLALEIYEHPLKQSVGAGMGVLIATFLFAGGYFFFSPLVATALTITIAAITVAKLERNRRVEALVWNLSLVAFVAAAIYFLKQIFS